MTQIVVTLENGADTNFLRRMIENMKGVLRTSLSTQELHDVNTASITPQDEETEKWIDNMKDLSNSIDASVIDMNDPRTKYIMSK